jgi:hypothetical protein
MLICRQASAAAQQRAMRIRQASPQRRVIDMLMGREHM